MRKFKISICDFLLKTIANIFADEINILIKKIIRKEEFSKRETKYYNYLSKIYQDNTPKVYMDYKQKNNIILFKASHPVIIHINKTDIVTEAGPNITINYVKE